LKFKIDENLPADYAAILRQAGFDADTVGDENISGADDPVVFRFSQAEDRALITLDLDFSNLKAYPCDSHGGIISLRIRTQDKTYVNWSPAASDSDSAGTIAETAVVDRGE